MTQDLSDLQAALREHAWSAVEEHPRLERLSADGIAFSASDAAALAALRTVERSTLPRLRRMLVSPTHADAAITGFLTTWAYERFWVADQLDQLLRGADRRSEPSPGGNRRRAARADQVERVRLLGAAVRTNLIGRPVVAVHMAQCLIDEQLTRASYRELGRRIGGQPAVDRWLAGVEQIKVRHAELFAAAVRTLAARNDIVGRIYLRHGLRGLRWPMGVRLSDTENRALSGLLKGAGADLVALEQELDELGVAGVRIRTPGPRSPVRLRIDVQQGRSWPSIRQSTPRARDV